MGNPRPGVPKKRTSRPQSTSGGPLGVREGMVALGLVGAFLVICFQLVRLQVVEAPVLADRAAKQHHKTIRLGGERGTITDRHGAILARNMEVPSITANPASISNPANVARTLARLLPASQKTLKKNLSNGRHFSWLARRTSPEVARKVMDLNIKGIYKVPESRRFYPKGELLSHTIGFAGLDNQGLAGVEQTYNSKLKGEDVTYVVERDALGRSVFPADSVYERPSHGADLTLTIDETIQHHAERELDLAMETTQAKSGSVIIMDPHTGEILALAVRPRFDPNRSGQFGPGDYRNRVVTDPYEPGSVMKIFLAAAAMDSGVVRLDELIDCEMGRMPMRGGAMHDTHPYGEIPFSQVLSKSSNIGSAKVAMRMGKNKLYAALTRFGFGSRTGIELPGESGGILPATSRWSGRSLASIAIGQELAVTPLQLVTAASVVANGGWLMRPYLVREVHQGDETIRFTPHRERRVISEKTATELREALVAVTEKGGTAPKGAVPGYRVAGKTGTAQKAVPGQKGYAKGKYVSSFLGMIPAENPRLVILVVIDEAKGKYYGGTVAAPVFRGIARPVLHYLGVHPQTERTLVLRPESL